MMTGKARFFNSLLILSTIVTINLISFGIAMAADNTQIVIDENLKPGMTLKDAIELLGPPDTIRTGDTGTVIMPYDSLGLSLEAMSDGKVIEAIHIKSTFKGKFSSAFGIGAGFQEILSEYNQPDIMTKETIEYSGRAMVFQISKGKLVGADLYSRKSTLYHPLQNKEAEKYVAEKVAEKKGNYSDGGSETYKDEGAATYVDEETEDDEDLADEEAEESDTYDKYDVFDLFGLKVANKGNKVLVTEIRPGSVAEAGGLKVGVPIRKISYKGLGSRNVYTQGGLKAILKRAVSKRKKYVNILQDEHYYYKVRVPRRD